MEASVTDTDRLADNILSGKVSCTSFLARLLSPQCCTSMVEVKEKSWLLIKLIRSAIAFHDSSKTVMVIMHEARFSVGMILWPVTPGVKVISVLNATCRLSVPTICKCLRLSGASVLQVSFIYLLLPESSTCNATPPEREGGRSVVCSLPFSSFHL